MTRFGSAAMTDEQANHAAMQAMRAMARQSVRMDLISSQRRIASSVMLKPLRALRLGRKNTTLESATPKCSGTVSLRRLADTRPWSAVQHQFH
jgi:hypothetical protein